MGYVRDMLFIHSGGLQTLEQLTSDFSVGEVVNRQELERQLVMVRLMRSKNMSTLNWREGITQDRRDRYVRYREADIGEELLQELQEAVNAEQAARDDYFVYYGGSQVLDHLIDKCDLKPGDYAPNFKIIVMPVDGTAVEAVPAGANGHPEMVAEV
jgi:hypothetical protein